MVSVVHVLYNIQKWVTWCCTDLEFRWFLICEGGRAREGEGVPRSQTAQDPQPVQESGENGKTHFASVYIAHSCVERQRTQRAFTKVAKNGKCTNCTKIRHFRERISLTLSLHTAACNVHACRVRLSIFATFLHGGGGPGPSVTSAPPPLPVPFLPHISRTI